MGSKTCKRQMGCSGRMIEALHGDDLFIVVGVLLHWTVYKSVSDETKAPHRRARPLDSR